MAVKNLAPKADSDGYMFGSSAADLIGFYGASPAAKNPVAANQNYEAQVLSASLTPASVAANTTAEQTFTVTGLVAGNAVFVNKPSAQAGLGIVNARVSAANTLAITYGNNTAGAITPAAETYLVLQMVAPTAGPLNRLQTLGLM